MLLIRSKLSLLVAVLVVTQACASGVGGSDPQTPRDGSTQTPPTAPNTSTPPAQPTPNVPVASAPPTTSVPPTSGTKNTNSVPTSSASPHLTGPLPTSITNFAQVTPFLLRGARPTQLDIKQLAAAGVKSILSLEEYVFADDAMTQEQQWSQAAGIQLLRVPMNGVTTPSVSDVLKAYNMVNTPANQPIFVHCLHGSDRTGLVIGAYRIKSQGWTPDAALDEMYQMGHSSLLSFWDKVLYQL